ncbi:MAG: cytochrome c oxidase assembly protein [Chloroflexota bacterium]
MDINGIAFHWVFEPSIVVGLDIWEFAYLLAINALRRAYRWGPPVPLARQIAFHLGTLCAVIALLSPLDGVADNYLFSAHMAQHMLLMFAAAPLWLLGIPDWLMERVLPRGVVRRVLNALVQPIVALVLFNGVVWFWHFPSVYDAALQNEALHIVEHLVFIGAAFIGWWPILGPTVSGISRPTGLTKLGYQTLSMLACTALAALITLARRPLFTYYGNAPLVMGLTPLADQQIGGIVMWLPGDMIYVGLLILTFYHWLSDDVQAAPVLQGLGIEG